MKKTLTLSMVFVAFALLLLVAGRAASSMATADGCGSTRSEKRCPDRGAGTGQEKEIDAEAPEQAGLPNPSAVYCEAQGHRYEIRTAADGSQSGACISDQSGAECDGWAYYRGECQLEPAAPAE